MFRRLEVFRTFSSTVQAVYSTKLNNLVQKSVLTSRAVAFYMGSHKLRTNMSVAESWQATYKYGVHLAHGIMSQGQGPGVHSKVAFYGRIPMLIPLGYSPSSESSSFLSRVFLLFFYHNWYPARTSDVRARNEAGTTFVAILCLVTTLSVSPSGLNNHIF